MLNEYFIDGIKVLEIKTVGGRKTKFFILENGEQKQVSKTKVGVKCSVCGCISKPVSFRYGIDKTPHVCFRCNQNKIWVGRKHTDATRNKQRLTKIGKYAGENNPMYGKNIKDYMTPEKYQEWLNKHKHINAGENNGFYGKHHTNEAKEIIIQKNKEYRESLTEEQKTKISQQVSKSQKKLYAADPERYKLLRSKAGKASINAQGRFKQTEVEILVKHWLEVNVSMKFEQVILGNYQFDFGNKDSRILVEVQGDYWHGNPKYFNLDGSDGKRKLNNIQIKKIKRDVEKKQFAEEHNFKLIYIWEDDIRNNNFSVLEELKDVRVC